MKLLRVWVALGVLVLTMVVAAPVVPPAAAQAPVTTFSGTANGRVFLGPFSLRAGLVTVTAKHTGSANFSVGLVLPKPGVDPAREYQAAYGLINVVGQYDGGAAVGVPDAGAYVLDVFASGAYQITVDQPVSANPATTGQREFAGRGQQITPTFVLAPGAYRIAATHNGKSNFQVQLFALNGATVSGDVFGRLVNVIGPYNDAVSLEIVADGPHLFHVNADGDWRITVTGGPSTTVPATAPTQAAAGPAAPALLAGVAQFRGTANGKQLLGPFDLSAGLVVVRAKHAGQLNFIAGLLLPKPGVDPRREYAAGYGMINVVGPYNGAAATAVTDAGSYLLDLDTSGAYEITVEQSTGATPAELPATTSFSGRGQQVTPVFALPAGSHRLTLTHTGKSNFQVWLYGLTGAQIGGDVFGRLVNEIGPYSGQSSVDVVLAAPVLFHVNADGDWTITID